MNCKKCRHFETVRGYGGYRVDRCSLNKGLTWDSINKEYIPNGYCRDGEVGKRVV